MTLAKIVADGVVVKAPEKRFTQNNLAITNLTVNLSGSEETLVRVVAKGNLAQTVEETVLKGDRVIVEGRLQNNTVKSEDGSEKRIVEIDAFAIEKLAGSSTSTPSVSKSPDSLVQFGQSDFSDDLIGEDEIPF